jgi:hypothetical protein
MISSGLLCDVTCVDQSAVKKREVKPHFEENDRICFGGRFWACHEKGFMIRTWSSPSTSTTVFLRQIGFTRA